MAETSKLLVSDFASSVTHIPSNYVRPLSDRPNLSEVQSSGDSIPLIDLQDLLGPNRAEIVRQLGDACSTYGFFQNHGVPFQTIENMINVAKEFFHQPESERIKHYSTDSTKTTRVSTSFNIKSDKILNWRDYLRLHCFPIEDFIEEWPSSPESFKEVTAEYATSVRALVLTLVEATSGSLGLANNRVSNTLGQQMARNYGSLEIALKGKEFSPLLFNLLQKFFPAISYLFRQPSLLTAAGRGISDVCFSFLACSFRRFPINARCLPDVRLPPAPISAVCAPPVSPWFVNLLRPSLLLSHLRTASSWIKLPFVFAGRVLHRSFFVGGYGVREPLSFRFSYENGSLVVAWGQLWLVFSAY